MAKIPMLAIDGPSGSGKSSVASLVARALGWHMLDSGSLYRLVALWSMTSPEILTDKDQLNARLAAVSLSFQWPSDPNQAGVQLLVNGKLPGDLRSPSVSKQASVIGVIPHVRESLLPIFRGFLQFPGLVAEGRDMASVVFPEASHCVYLQASSEIRAKRRYKQLQQAKRDVSLSKLTAEIVARDQRDSQRAIAPLTQVDSAKVIDTSQLSLNDVVAQIVSWVESDQGV